MAIFWLNSVDFLAEKSILSEGEDEMAAKKTMTLNLTDAEMLALDELSEKKDLSKTAVIRQALRLYQMVSIRIERGDKLFFEDEAKKEKAEVMVL
jgi:predicted transcriptional regulator